MAQCKVCGCDDGAAKDSRSVPQIRRYFGIIRALYDTWPERHEEQFESPEALRKFLQMKAGYREIALDMPIFGVKADRLVPILRAALQSAGTHARPVEYKGRLVVWKPRSIAFASMPHKEFCKLVEDVETVIEAETGIRAEQLEREAA